MLVGYARVSTEEQETNLQIDAMLAFGVQKVWQEKASAVSRRPVLAGMLSSLKPGDVVVVYKVDRMARSLADLLALLERIENAGASFKSITEPIETNTSVGRLLMQMVGAFAEFERNLIRERTAAGMAAARSRGVRFGRSRAMSARDEAECVAKFRTGNYSKSALARIYGCHLSSVKRALARAVD
jgi:DNA invertase Pin-like site-specific DNA recombinase